ncbi:unnamed protein product [Urochloa decumbens]|uniref:Uncharacterized protein n=1 Tax=Urochloa decumbens TaxID=240449 RepID=A0ABC8YAV7_9POAL
MSRRFLNLVYRDYAAAADNLLYSVTRLDASQLFYKSAAAATAAARKKNNGSTQAPVISSIADIPEIRRLPSPSFSFQPFRSKMYHIIKGEDVFAPFGAGRILCADGAGYAAAFDMASRSMLGMPTMNAPKGPMHVTISSIPRTEQHAFAAYRFDTVTQEWDKAGDWALPIIGKTEHVPELGVWLGLSAQKIPITCAPSARSTHPRCGMSGRFCTAKFFDVSEDIKDDDAYETAVVFTGVEVLRCDDESAGGLKMIKHKSKRVMDLDIISVL